MIVVLMLIAIAMHIFVFDDTETFFSCKLYIVSFNYKCRNQETVKNKLLGQTFRLTLVPLSTLCAYAAGCVFNSFLIVIVVIKLLINSQLYRLPMSVLFLFLKTLHLKKTYR